jgi:IS6 family transposase
LITRTAAGYSYSGNWASSTGGIYHPLEHQLASLQPQPRVINTDLAPIYSSAISDTKKEGTLRNRCRHRPVQYLNNILEQDHRAIKRRVNAKQGFREFQAARRTIQGYEAIHMIRKGQARWVAGDDLLRQIQFIDSLFDLAA